jgi:glutamate-1-semialdehyde aminotransferase
MKAGLTTLRLLEDGRLISRLNKIGKKIREQLRGIFEANNIDAQVIGDSSLFNVHFTKQNILDANAVYKADRKRLFDYNLNLIANGVFLLPTHNGALSTAHSEEDIEKLFSETEKYAKKLD